MNKEIVVIILVVGLVLSSVSFYLLFEDHDTTIYLTAKPKKVYIPPSPITLTVTNFSSLPPMHVIKLNSSSPYSPPSTAPNITINLKIQPPLYIRLWPVFLVSGIGLMGFSTIQIIRIRK
ncbi:MAG: hypothetical protein RXR43_14840 [Sulfolobus sp.]